MYKLRNSGYSGPVIAITGYLEDWDEEDLMDLGFNHIIPKPFEAAAILECLMASLENGFQEGEAASAS